MTSAAAALYLSMKRADAARVAAADAYKAILLADAIRLAKARNVAQ